MKSVHDNSRFKVYRGNGKETFECQICQKDFSKTAKGLNSAMKFSTFNGLKNHFLILHKDSNFQACVCHVCYGSFRAHKLLRAHLKNVHNLNYGNISVPQNQEANDKIVDTSKGNGHNNKFLESIEQGSSNGVRQIPPISIEECQKTNQLPQPGKQQQQAEEKQDLEKELNIQNHWQKEKQHLENKEEIRKQTRHQWKKQRQEWKKWDPKKQLKLKEQVQPENPQNIEKQQHIGFLLPEQLQEQLQKQQHHPKSVQKQAFQSIEQQPSLLQKQLQEKPKKQQNNQISVQKQPIDKMIEQAALREQPQEQVQKEQSPQGSVQKQPKQKQSLQQLQKDLQKQQNHQKSVQKEPINRTEQQSLLQKQLQERPQKQQNPQKSAQKQPIDKIEQELAMLTQSESNVSFSDLSPLLQNIELELQKNKDLQMLYDPRHGLSSLPCPKQLGAQANNKNSKQQNNENGIIITNSKQQLNVNENSRKQQKQTSIIKNHSLSRPICPSLLQQANKHNEQPNNEKGVIITNNDQLNEKEQAEKISNAENYQQQKQVQTIENRIVSEIITVVEDMHSTHQNGAQAQKRNHSELEEIAKEAESFNCQYCGDSFNTTRSLIVHEKVMHRNVQPNNNHQNQEKLSQLQKLQEIAKEQNELMGNLPPAQPVQLESTKKDSNAVQKLRAFRKQKPRQSISKPSSTVEKVENPKLHSCLKCGETFEWGSEYLRHNRLVHIQAKINSLYSKLALEPVTWS